MSASLPLRSFDLPPWPGEVVRSWSEWAERAQRITHRAGTGKNFEKLLTEARTLLTAGEEAAIARRLGERRFARAVVTAWYDDAALASATMSIPLVEAFRRAQSVRPSRLATITLTAVFLEHFDGLDRWSDGLFTVVSGAIRSAANALPGRSASDVVDTLRAEGAFLLDPQGPMTLARHLLTTGVDLSQWLRAHGLAGYADGRFGQLTRDAFYLVQIEDADPELEGHPFLRAVTDEVVTRQRSESTAADGLYFGHQVLTALTGKTTRHPSDEWLTAVTSFAGDPRLRQTPQWDTWWSRVDERNVARAVRWMSGVDLRAFLDGIEQYAHAHGKQDMIRMLGRRKRLLEGLYVQDRVEDVRLILGDDIRRWIRSSTPLSTIDSPRLVDPGKQDTAVIYLDCGDFRLVEGSHNFQLHLYTRKPVPRLSDRRTRVFTGDDLRYRIPTAHGPGYEAFRHDPQGGWVRSALDFLRREGVRIDERALVTTDDYAALQRRRARDRY